MVKGLYIGELARLTGLNTNTIRYYESQGLLLRAERSESGYRVYREEDADRLRFIQKAKTLGLSLTEVKDILDHRAEGVSPCSRVATFLDQRIVAVDQRIRDLTAFKDELVTLRHRMPPGDEAPGKFCGFIEGVELKEGSESEGKEG